MYVESVEEATDCARSALQRMADEGIPADPRNFAVWYEYASGRNQPLIRAIDTLASSGKAIDPTLGTDLYDSFIAPSTERNVVREIGDRVQTTLESVIDVLWDAGSDASQYGERLRQASNRLSSDGMALVGLKEVVEALVNDTRRAEEKNRQLDERLKDSAAQMQRMREDLDVARREALTDGLTGIANRKFFDLQLRRAAIDSMETGKPLSLLMIDLDFFKKINDEHGHRVGDEVLKLVARVLQASIKGQDMAARYGGEEFSIILPETVLRNAVAVGEYIRRAVASRQVVQRGTGTTYGTITLSIGAAQHDPAESLSSLIARADAALYQAKKNGRNRVMPAAASNRAAAIG